MRITERSIFTVTWWVGLCALVVVVVTGVWLSFAYRPSAADAWDDLGMGGSSPSATLTSLHLAAAWTLAGSAAVGALVGLLDLRRGLSPRVAMVLTVPAVWLSFQLGRLLPWEQLALWAVVPPSGLSGVNVRAILRDDIRFLLVDGREVDPDVYLAAVLAHFVVAAILVAGWVTLGAIGSAGRVRRSQQRTGQVEDRPDRPLSRAGPGSG